MAMLVDLFFLLGEGFEEELSSWTGVFREIEYVYIVQKSKKTEHISGLSRG